jgi:glycerophosphoryl diester phosphodiesterase
MPNRKPIIVAHRGLHHQCVENSLGAFIAAEKAGVRWVECDVWPSADGTPMVIHDETLDRTTPNNGLVRNHSRDQLQELNVPSLPDLLAALNGKTGILVEIKPPNAVEFTGKIRDMLMHYPGPWMMQSFYLENVIHKSKDAFLVEDSGTLQTAADGDWTHIHAEHVLIDRDLVDRLHAAGRTIGAWTVNNPADIQRMIDLGIDMLITDEPVTAAQLIAEK